MQPTPTVVVGVGQAGITVLNRIHASDGLGWGSEYDEFFEYVAIDSSSDALQTTPEEVARVHLPTSKQTHMQKPTQSVEADVRSYPYLTTEFEI